jgi:hypothetical protein
MWRDRLADYLIDISKYLITGVFITSLFEDFKGYSVLIYSLSVIVAAMFLIGGLMLSYYKKKN